MTKQTETKISKAFAGIAATIGFTGSLVYLSVMPSQAKPLKAVMHISQGVAPEPTNAPSPSVTPDSVEDPAPKATPDTSVPPDSLDNVEFDALGAKVLEISKQFAQVDPKTHLATFDAKGSMSLLHKPSELGKIGGLIPKSNHDSRARTSITRTC